jgi:hypothetical protein
MAISQLLGLGIVIGAGAIASTLTEPVAVGLLHLVGALVGIVIGVSQWLVLRSHIRHSNRWIIATIAGALVGWMVGVKASIFLALVTGLGTRGLSLPIFFEGVVLLGAWVGLVLGFAQWFVLQANFPGAGWWIPANMVAWALGLAVAFLGAGMANQMGWDAIALAGIGLTGILGGAVVGAITGAVLIRLMRSQLGGTEAN